MRRRTGSVILKFIAVALSTLPPILATLSYFPIWKKGGGVAVISGFALLLILVSLSPLIKLLRRIFASPTSTTVWFVIFLLFFTLSKIANEMVVISLVGYLGNLFASLLWRISERGKNEE